MNRKTVSILSAVLIVIATLAGGILFVHAAGSLAIDASARCHDPNWSGCTMSLSTSSPNDLIIVISASVSGGGVGTFDLARDTAGLAYSNRAEQLSSMNGVREDSAVASGVLTNDIITCQQRGNLNARISCVAFAISGAGTFDGSPCFATGTTTTPSCNKSTANPNDMMIGGESSGNVGTIAAGSGYTTIASNVGDGSGNAYAEYKVGSSAQVSSTLSSSQQWDFIGDALKGSGSTTTSSSTSTSSTTSTTTTSSTTTSSTTTMTTTTTTSTTSTVPPTVFYYTGATSSDTNALSNAGIRATLEAVPQSVKGGQIGSLWISDYLQGNLWLQVGYYYATNATAIPFESIYNLGIGIALSGVNGPSFSTASSIYHTYMAKAINATAWGFFFDEIQFATYNFGTAIISDSSKQIQILAETQSSGPMFAPNPTVSQSMQYFKGGTWNYLASAVAYSATSTVLANTLWNVQGKLQDPSDLSNDQLIIGGSGSVSSSTLLWNGVG